MNIDASVALFAGPSTPERSTTYADSLTYARIPEIPLPEEVGERLKVWFETPFDAAVFPLRLFAGAVLSTPERLSNVGDSIEQLQDLAQFPISDAAKQRVVMQKAEKCALPEAALHACVLDQLLCTPC